MANTNNEGMDRVYPPSHVGQLVKECGIGIAYFQPFDSCVLAQYVILL